MISSEFSGGFILVGLLAATLSCAVGQADASSSHLETGRRSSPEPQDLHRLKTTIRTQRIDPLDGFKKYRGGFNVTDDHYWSSTIFTGFAGYGIALVWLMGGALCSVALCYAREGKRKELHTPCTGHRPCCRRRLWAVVIGILLTLLAIVASVVALAGSCEFHSRANAVNAIIAGTAEMAAGTIHNVTRAMGSLQRGTVLYGDLKGAARLASATNNLTFEAAMMEKKAEDIFGLIGRSLEMLQAATVATVSVNLLVIILLSASGLLKLGRLLCPLLVLSWLLTVLFWICFGLCLFVDRFAGDTCVAFDQYLRDPGNSSLGEIIPCNRQVSAKSAMRESRARIHDFIDKVNANLSKRRHRSPAAALLPPRSFVCNPFSPPPEYRYRPENCSEGEIRPEDIPQILGGHACSIGDDRACGILTYAAAAQSLLSLFPTLEELASCRPVREAFAGVVSGHCGPLGRSSRMALAGIAALATTMVFLVLAWATAASQDCKHHTSNVSNHCQRQEMGSPAQSPA